MIVKIWMRNDLVHISFFHVWELLGTWERFPIVSWSHLSNLKVTRAAKFIWISFETRRRVAAFKSLRFALLHSQWCGYLEYAIRGLCFAIGSLYHRTIQGTGISTLLDYFTNRLVSLGLHTYEQWYIWTILNPSCITNETILPLLVILDTNR